MTRRRDASTSAFVLAALCVLAGIVGGCGGGETREGAPDPAVLNAEGEKLLRGGSPQSAIPIFVRAVEASRASGDRRSEALSSLNLARARGRAGEIDAALADLDRAEELFSQLSSGDGVARARAARAGAYYLRGDIELARKELRRAMAVAPDATAAEILNRVSAFLEELSLAAVDDGARAESRLALLEAVELGGVETREVEQAETLITLAEGSARAGRDPEAAKYYREAARAYRKMGMTAAARDAEARADEHLRPGPSSFPGLNEKR